MVKNNYELVSLLDLFERLADNGPSPSGAVAFAIDDGYIDRATIAAPLFSQFDCPITAFVSTGLLDGKIWFWWDQIEHVFESTACQSVSVSLGNTVLDYRCDGKDQRIQAQAEFTATCKLVDDDVKLAAIAQLARNAEVEIPNNPPSHCAPISWEHIRTCEKLGMTFGPRTVTHPVLIRTMFDVTNYEITESWARLRAEARSPAPVFCYPNGGWDDCGDRKIAILQRLGFLDAVVGEPGYPDALAFQRGPVDPFKVQRFDFPDQLPHMIQCVSGLERFKQKLWRSA